MAKISLEELKARSRELGFNPECIELVRAAKSPTAAYELSIARGSYPEFAKKCRYLAMIKRDYGKAAFERERHACKHFRCSRIHDAEIFAALRRLPLAAEVIE